MAEDYIPDYPTVTKPIQRGLPDRRPASLLVELQNLLRTANIKGSERARLSYYLNKAWFLQNDELLGLIVTNVQLSDSEAGHKSQQLVDLMKSDHTPPVRMETENQAKRSQEAPK